MNFNLPALSPFRYSFLFKFKIRQYLNQFFNFKFEIIYFITLLNKNDY